LFGILGLIASIPLLLRLKRRFASWWAPMIGLAVFAVMFSVSAFVIGPAISGLSSGGSCTRRQGRSAQDSLTSQEMRS
jgi:hypothetical protein